MRTVIRLNKSLVDAAIARCVNTMAGNEADISLPRMYNQRVERWFKSKDSGEIVVWSVDTFVIDEDDLFDHIRRAKRLHDATIETADYCVTVRRINLRGDEGITVTYTPDEEV